ncbi:MAG: hypothetical protein KatS3mg129_0126 [Leptospiraceae bacterium]|nr:MAG: hypothetical protein KatS3mg129_0126 [Leptospiraceae bacterium]
MDKQIQELYILAKKSEENQKWQEALNYYTSIFVYKDKKDYSVLPKIGFLYAKLGNYKESYKALRKYLEFDKKNWSIYYQIAIVCIHLNHLELAKKYLNQAITLNKQNIKLLTLLGYVYELSNDYKNSLKIFKAVIKQDPHNKIAIKGIIFSLMQLNKYQEAIQFCEKYLKIFPDDLTLKNFHAAILYELGKTDQFLEEIKEISDKDQRYKSFDEYLNKIKTDRNQEYEDFLNDLQTKMIQKTKELEIKEDKKTYLDLSLLSLFSGNKNEAFEYLKKALESEK